ncbi:helix-turn-helix domain-containing protein [Fibrella sp. HMF5335]|uniref:Helix-turn-helix domain-containing protein n=1 Tax=Fibrella rubiginis TaxID=2817060 RepID=A0A939GKW8_9BACT|nr:helix-turn-helix domain-containing protein [Fibrella rubiginis]MBO0938700.1 helix-turn-helix domain-containing protein [Fibrella rubiginis]
MVIIQIESTELSNLIQNAVREAISNQSGNTALQTEHRTGPDEEKPLNVAKAAEFLDISEQTVYQNIKKIPHRKRFGRLYFLKSELIAYLEAGVQNRN